VFGLFNRSSETPSSEPGPFGKYHLRELINNGGMAELWLATDAKNRSVAVRRLHSHLKFDFTAKKRFVRGCEVLQKVQDDRLIIGYIEHDKVDGQWFLAMDYVEGANLKELYARQDPVLTENIAQILIDMAESLEHVHESGFIHLDFKPENVMVSRNGSVRLVDFDLAMEIPSEPVKLKKNPGTPAYMSPEQLSGQPIDQRVDVFAYGVAAYELLTNQKPFPGESSAEILSGQLNRTDFIQPRQINGDIPPGLEKIILKCIETDPNRRYPFLSVLARDLKSVLYV
jgi:serine/threonine-protein kinase